MSTELAKTSTTEKLAFRFSPLLDSHIQVPWDNAFTGKRPRREISS